MSLEGRRPLKEDDVLDLDTWEILETAHILTNKPGIHALRAWLFRTPAKLTRHALSGGCT